MINEHIQGLIQKAIEAKLIFYSDRIYIFNQLLSFLGIESCSEITEQITEDSIPDLLEKITVFAVENNIIEDNFDEKEILTANIMNHFVARPSTINKIFQQKYKNSPKEATDYFYELSKNSNYIQMKRIKKNIHFKAETVYGKMDITINMSKPEKDPEQIKREREFKTNSNYPKCVLCMENEGYVGRVGYPARANHRIIGIQLGDENWYLQYSPYVYYNEHSILLAEEHRPMKISKGTFQRLLTFIEKFPHYFIGSNADLPIVGGSILSHNHYQAGRYDFPMTNASTAFSFILKNYSSVISSTLDWPLATIRLQSNEKDSLVQAADHILTKWKSYSDKKAEIIPFTGDTPHNTVTPIARMRGRKFELDLVLRNNRTTEEHPFGIFHPHSDVHHIKKENIGLIEVMGLAALPARLKNELDEIKRFLLVKQGNVAPYHQEWAEQLNDKYGELSDLEQIESALEKEVGDKFAKVLGDAGVFKKHAEFERFIKSLNIESVN